MLQKDIDFVRTRLFSGDESAITNYKNFYKASTEQERRACEINAQGFFNKTAYEKIIN
ncbi:hypothetical protein [Commensalibacter oyaizuii]|uniref:Uncharacterized protein n=1 Tax=Commensalibacter oyaizuii TaxID=3043873 RepID=A0ABT6Q1W8_9PROT|nr:hypothetical protein [Commensalibacter sp. TBRC 16381]MDI2091108.1 hypothetical protein [Commensalibacter sp. TBRC 16381]